MADLTPDFQVCLSWGSIAESFHSLQSLSVSCFHVILGLPGPRFPSTCMPKAVLTAPLEISTCPYQRSLLSFRMRSRSSLPSRTSSSLDLVVKLSCGLTLQTCLIFIQILWHKYIYLMKTSLAYIQSLGIYVYLFFVKYIYLCHKIWINKYTCLLYKSGV